MLKVLGIAISGCLFWQKGRISNLGLRTPSPPENEKRRWKNYKIGVLEGRLYASEERKEALDKFFFLLEMSASMGCIRTGCIRTGLDCPGTMVESHWMREKAGETVWGVTKKIPRMEDEESNTIVSD